MCTYVYIYVHICTYIYIYVHMYVYNLCILYIYIMLPTSFIQDSRAIQQRWAHDDFVFLLGLVLSKLSFVPHGGLVLAGSAMISHGRDFDGQSGHHFSAL